MSFQFVVSSVTIAYTHPEIITSARTVFDRFASKIIPTRLAGEPIAVKSVVPRLVIVYVSPLVK